MAYWVEVGEEGERGGESGGRCASGVVFFGEDSVDMVLGFSNMIIGRCTSWAMMFGENSVDFAGFSDVIVVRDGIEWCRMLALLIARSNDKSEREKRGG
jgi:hypothetical protein